MGSEPIRTGFFRVFSLYDRSQCGSLIPGKGPPIVQPFPEPVSLAESLFLAGILFSLNLQKYCRNTLQPLFLPHIGSNWLED